MPRMSVARLDFSGNAGHGSCLAQDGKQETNSELPNGLRSPGRGHRSPLLTVTGPSRRFPFLAVTYPLTGSLRFLPPTSVCLPAFSLEVPPCVQAQGLPQRRCSMNTCCVHDEVKTPGENSSI